MHKLTTYRKDAGLTMLKTAEALGVSEAIISLWEAGKRTPRFRHIRMVEKFTNGAVTANDWDLHDD